MNRRRIALFAMGIIGGGSLSQGIPVLEDLFTRLSKHFDITFYCFQPIDKSRVPSSIRVRTIGSWSLPGRLKFGVLFLKFSIDHWRRPFHAVFAVSVYPTGRAAVLAGKLFNVPSIVQIIALEAVALPEIGAGNLVRPWLRDVTRHVFRRATHVIAVADYQKAVAEASLPISRPISTLPLRINYSNFKYRTREPKVPLRLIHIAFYSPVKDQECLFKAFADIVKQKQAMLTVVGDGYDRPEVKQLLHELGIIEAVQFTGPVLQSEIPSLLDEADILVHPARFETGCAVIQEAMASGVAVCGTRVGLLCDIGDEYAGIVEVGDHEALGRKVLEISDNLQLYRRITANAYKFISTYDAAWMETAYRAFLESAIADHAHPLKQVPRL